MQTTQDILLIRPSSFGFNSETEMSNAFQNKLDEHKTITKERAIQEFDAFALKLKSKNINVRIFNDTPIPVKPDAIFPNNWVSFHSTGKVILYPMFASNRRLERRQDIIESLKKDYKITDVLDLSPYEKENKFLEGTGSMIFDHKNKFAYACLSPRTDKELFLKVCSQLNYKPIYFHACDQSGKEIYHTNVMLCIGNKFAVICLESITNKEERKFVYDVLEETQHDVVEISFKQMQSFAANMLEIQNKNGEPILALSQSSYNILTTIQKNTLERYCELLPLSIETIETIGGGSARCMIAELFLEKIVRE